MHDVSALGERIVGILSEDGARELLGLVSQPGQGRAGLIRERYVGDDAAWLSWLLTDLDADEHLRLQVVDALQGALEPNAPHSDHA